jgi:hypothetical protein
MQSTFLGEPSEEDLGTFSEVQEAEDIINEERQTQRLVYCLKLRASVGVEPNEDTTHD